MPAVVQKQMLHFLVDLAKRVLDLANRVLDLLSRVLSVP
jgi:hypothetical protein